jgi:hypothetical protein
MKSNSSLIWRKLLMVVMLFLMAVALSGCLDPVVAQMEAEHERLGAQLENDIRMNSFAYPTSYPQSRLYPAP